MFVCQSANLVGGTPGEPVFVGCRANWTGSGQMKRRRVVVRGRSWARPGENRHPEDTNIAPSPFVNTGAKGAVVS